MLESISISTHADERFYIIVPGCKIFVPNGPVNTNAVFCIRLKIQIAPAITGPCPQDRAPANDVSSYPIKSFDLVIFIFLVVDVKMFVVFSIRIVPALDKIFFFVCLRQAEAMIEFPGMLISSRIIWVNK